MYMQMKTGAFKEDFCKNTIYRFLSNTKINGQKAPVVMLELLKSAINAGHRAKEV